MKLKRGSDEHRLALSRMRGGKAVLRTCNVDGMTKIYPFIKAVIADGFSEAAVRKCCKGKQKYHKGFKFEYTEEEKHE